MPYNLQLCDPPPELAHFWGGHDRRFVTVETGWAEASSQRPLRSAAFKGCSAYLFTNNKTSLAQLFHIYPSQILEHIERENSVSLLNARLKPFLAHMRAAKAEVTMIPILGSHSANRCNLFTSVCHADNHHVAEIVRFNSQSKFKSMRSWELYAPTIPWDLSYRPEEGVLYLKTVENGCFRAKVHTADLPVDTEFERKLQLLDRANSKISDRLFAAKRKNNGNNLRP